MVFVGFLGAVGIAMSMVVSLSYLNTAYQLTGEAGVSMGLVAWIWFSALFGAMMLWLGTFFFTQGVPISWGRIPKNRAYRILSINQFKAGGSKHLLVVPLNRENADPRYLILNSKRFPKGAMPGHVIEIAGSHDGRSTHRGVFY